VVAAAVAGVTMMMVVVVGVMVVGGGRWVAVRGGGGGGDCGVATVLINHSPDAIPWRLPVGVATTMMTTTTMTITTTTATKGAAPACMLVHVWSAGQLRQTYNTTGCAPRAMGHAAHW
jgi:hypothetical protein